MSVGCLMCGGGIILKHTKGKGGRGKGEGGISNLRLNETHVNSLFNSSY